MLVIPQKDSKIRDKKIKNATPAQHKHVNRKSYEHLHPIHSQRVDLFKSYLF